MLGHEPAEIPRHLPSRGRIGPAAQRTDTQRSRTTTSEAGGRQGSAAPPANVEGSETPSGRKRMLKRKLAHLATTAVLARATPAPARPHTPPPRDPAGRP